MSSRGRTEPFAVFAQVPGQVPPADAGAVDPDSLPADTEITHRNLYDGTVEGLRHTVKPVFSVQYHPEASPGPHDADYLFRQFVDLMEQSH